MVTRPGLSIKYALLIAGLVSVVLVVGGSLGLYFFGRENLARVSDLHREKAVAAAARIELYVRDIEHQMSWTALPRPDGGEAELEQHRWEYLKLLRQVPAVTDLLWLDATGRERLRVSRLSMDRTGAGDDWSGAPSFQGALRGEPYYSAVYFRNGTEPYMTVARAAGDEAGDGVLVAQVNLKFVWDVVSRIDVGRTGLAYVTDAGGTLIAHPDISLVLQKTSLAVLPQVHHLLWQDDGAEARERLFVRDFSGREVLSAQAAIPELGWHVFVDLPREEALEPVYASIQSGILLLVAAVLASVVASTLLARRMVQPVKALQAGVQALGAGRLDQRVEVGTGDELQALATEFNMMSGRLRESYATLEHKVEQRTLELTAQRRRADAANVAKTRFLAAASHDLRQPMHAMNLYLGALAGLDLSDVGRRVLGNVRQCAQAMDGLLDGLLDISRLDANAVEADIRDFCIAPLLERLRVEFEPQAHAKGLALRIAPSGAWVHSDAALVERILRNLVSNAVRHSRAGKILVGCRRKAGALRLAVHDTGPGIPEAQQQLVFEEFYQLGNPGHDREQGLGLGLSIVRRLAVLLGARLSLVSRVNRGSMFAIDLPLAAPAATGLPARSPAESAGTSLIGTLIVVVDDEAAILGATQLVLEQWGCEVVAVSSGAQAIEALAACASAPDALVCDFRLGADGNGLDVIEALRDEFNRQIPALIITGDIVPEDLTSLREAGMLVLHKPVPPALLRDTLARLIGAAQESEVPSTASAIPRRRAANAA